MLEVDVHELLLVGIPLEGVIDGALHVQRQGVQEGLMWIPLAPAGATFLFVSEERLCGADGPGVKSSNQIGDISLML